MNCLCLACPRASFVLQSGDFCTTWPLSCKESIAVSWTMLLTNGFRKISGLLRVFILASSEKLVLATVIERFSSEGLALVSNKDIKVLVIMHYKLLCALFHLKDLDRGRLECCDVWRCVILWLFETWQRICLGLGNLFCAPGGSRKLYPLKMTNVIVWDSLKAVASLSLSNCERSSSFDQNLSSLAADIITWQSKASEAAMASVEEFLGDVI